MRHIVTITLVVNSEQDGSDVREWAKLLIDTQGDDQMRVQKRTIKVETR